MLVTMKIKRKLGYMAGCLLLLLAMGSQVRAAETESTAEMTLQQITKDVEMKEEPDEKSSTLEELKAGTAVIVEGMENSWSKVRYKEKSGYIQSDALEFYDAGQMESLDQELQEVGEGNQRIVDEYELTQKEKHTSMIWGIVIAVLVAGIFAVGIVSAVKQNKEGDKQ